MKLKQINKAYIVRTLACLSFVIFFCPFLQTCSNESIKEFHKNDISTINIKRDTINGEIIENNEELTYYNSDLFKNSKKEYTHDFYKMAYFPLKEFDIKNFFDYEFYIYLILNLVILFSFIMVYYASKSDFFKVKKFSILALFILHIYLVLLIFKLVIEDLAQIKYGYYLFLINLILIIHFSNQLIKEQKN